MLSNAYFLAKFHVDLAENEPAKNLQILKKEKKDRVEVWPNRGMPAASYVPEAKLYEVQQEIS